MLMLFLPTLYTPLLTGLLYQSVFDADPAAQRAGIDEFTVKHNRVLEDTIIGIRGK